MSSHYARRPRSLRVIAVTSGKGGVGKTNLTVNLGLTFARQGRRVLLVDGDVGLANVDILLDESPRYSLRDVLSGERGIDDVLLESPHGLTVLPGSSGVPELTLLSSEDRVRLLTELETLDEGRFDTVLVDTAAGIGANAVFFACAAQEVLVVATPEPTSLADAYAMIKVLSRRHGVDRVGLVLNQVAGEAEAVDIYQRLGALTARFLPVVLELVAWVPTDPRVHAAVMGQEPLLVAYPSAPASRAIERLAETLVMRPAPRAVSGRLQLFWRRLLATPAAASAVAPTSL